MNKEEQRKEFEEWLETVIYDNSNILSPSGLAWDAWQAASEQLTAVTEQRDGLRSGIDYASDQLSKVTEQRDRLAEILRNCMPFILDDGCLYRDAREALQSLTNPNEL